MLRCRSGQSGSEMSSCLQHMRICGAGVCESGLEAANVSALRLKAAQSGEEVSAAYAPSCRQFDVCGGGTTV